MKEFKEKYYWRNREDFVRERYDDYNQFISEYSKLPTEQQDTIIFTDLDEYDSGKQIKDIILCDRCNEDILEPVFIGAYNEYVYHFDCIKDELPKALQIGIDIHPASTGK